MFDRWKVLKNASFCFAALLALIPWNAPDLFAQVAGGSLDPAGIPKYQDALIIPPAMPRSTKVLQKGGSKNIDYYEIAVRQFDQYILPQAWSQASGISATTVWSYGAVDVPGTATEGGSFNFPAFTIEAKYERPLRVKWINDLKNPDGTFIPHLLPVDQTLHWANPPGFLPDTRGSDPDPYLGPVPIVTHVHGAHTYQESDGYPEAWYLPDATNMPGYVNWTTGTMYETFKSSSPLGSDWEPGSAVFEYPNDQRATTLWYHDHSLGITRLNVYAGPAGFYLLRGGPDDMVTGTLPGPAPAIGDPPGIKYYEIPIVIQDRSFNEDGSLFYPDNRAFFEGLEPAQLQIPFIPDDAIYPDNTNLGPSDVSPIWNPEFFGNTMVVNGRTWPYLEVDQRRYRFRFLNGCNSRFLILKFDNGMPFWQIGTEGGFLPAPLELNELLIGPAERADVIVDFNDVPVGTKIVLQNLGPDEPFGGGTPGADFDPADPGTTGQVMEFRVVKANGKDKTTSPDQLVLPPLTGLGPESNTRRLSLNEEESATILVSEDASGNVVLDLGGEVFGPTSALLGTVDDGPKLWMDDVTENPVAGATEIWEIHNFTMDAHPIHIHLVQFQVVDRRPFGSDPRPPESWETGYKDTVISYPGEITRVKARFDIPGLFVWHCHILEHEDNEMMRPYQVLQNQ